MVSMTEEERKDKVSALLREREAYQRDGKTDRVEQVDAALRALGHRGAAPHQRAETRPASRDAERR